ncbi:MAG: substrate-binding domain-containing protein [Gemmatimonadaceae bacterium]|nr:substrate-binding domain-containing protein [Gemmatimonadota bacterium]MBK9409360.1 substrate-binding domain-containing protein [Gemmatimonadota bacterium]MCC7325168.1 substrate-binding domain-containing protein [Gemmatimonadaceae bacterium]
MRRSLALVAAAFLMSACGKEQGTRKLIGFSQANLGEPWRVAMNAEVAEAAKGHPELEFVYADAQQDNAKQVADVENFLRQKIDLLIISPNEAKPLTPIVKRAFESGIPVVVLDREIEGETYTTFIGANNRDIGKAAGEYVATLLGGTGAVVEIKGLPGSTPARDRSEGFREAIAGFPGIRIVHDPVANWLREEAMTQMESALSAHPTIDLVYAHNDPMAMGAYLAAKAKGRDSAMKFIGIDGLPGLDGGRQAVQDGKLAATFVYPTGGREAVDIAVRILKGEQVPHRITLGTERITK